MLSILTLDYNLYKGTEMLKMLEMPFNKYFWMLRDFDQFYATDDKFSYKNVQGFVQYFQNFCLVTTPGAFKKYFR